MKAVAHRLHVSKVLSHQFHKVIVIQMAGGCDDHIPRHKALAVEVHDRFALEALDRVASAQDRAPQRMVLPEILGEDFMDQVVGAVLIHFDFFQDHAALAHNIVGGEGGIQNQVTEYVECDGQMLVEHFDAEADALFGGEGVDVAADGIHLTRNFFCRAMLGPFEDHVLDEMRNPVPVLVFVTRAGLDPNPDADGADMLHLFSDDGQPIGQRGASDIAVCVHMHSLPFSHTRERGVGRWLSVIKTATYLRRRVYWMQISSRMVQALPRAAEGMNAHAQRVLLGLHLQELTKMVEESGQPAYRARQLFRAIYTERVSSADQVSTLPKEFRSMLSRESFSLGLPGIQKKFVSSDGTVRYLIELADHEIVETVWMPEGDGGEAGDGSEAAAEIETHNPRGWRRATICVSSQVGCAVNCQFCLTALLGIRRNLSAG